MYKEQSRGGNKKFSFYKKPVMNTKPDGEWTLKDAYNYITTNADAKSNTDELRAKGDENEQRDYKKDNFATVTFSGCFSQRSSSNLLQHSGYMSIDIDHVDVGLEELKSKLIEDEIIEPELVFISPSGKGLKVVTTIDLEVADHQKWFYAIKGYISEKYGISIDEKCKDVSRACFLPYDKDCFIKYL